MHKYKHMDDVHSLRLIEQQNFDTESINDIVCFGMKIFSAQFQLNCEFICSFNSLNVMKSL